MSTAVKLKDAKRKTHAVILLTDLPSGADAEEQLPAATAAAVEAAIGHLRVWAELGTTKAVEPFTLVSVEPVKELTP